MNRFLATVILALFWACVCLPAGANDSATVGVGGSVMLMRSHPSVVMESAKINIHLVSESVECNYVLHNTGEETDVLVGFPEESSGGVAGNKGFKDFRSYVDGQEVPVEPRPALENLGGGFERFWVKQVHFAGGQTRAVRNTYFGGRGTGGAGDEWFAYDVSTAASWKGTVGDLRVSIDLTDIGPDFQADDIRPSGYERSKDEIVWHWKDIEPIENIYIGFCRWYRDVWVDGKNDLRDHGVITLWVENSDDWIKQGVIPGAPSMATGILTADLFRIAEWLGVDGPSEPAGDKPATLTGRGRSMTFVPGQAVASVDGHEVVLGGTVRQSNDKRSLEVPALPVAKALGFSTQFDPLTKRTYLWSQEALAAAKPSEWLTRGLSENDLRDKSSEELRMMRNEVYARQGREFQDKDLRHHFYCQPWYQPKPNYTDALLNETDRANIALLAKLEKERASTTEKERPTTMALYLEMPQDLLSELSKCWVNESSGQGETVDPLVACLDNENWGVRFRAAWLLGLLGDVRAADPLIAFLKHQNFPPEWFASAREALCNLKYEPATAEARMTLLFVLEDWERLAQEGPAAVALLVTFVKEEENEDARTAAAGGLVHLGTPGVEALATCLKDPNKNVCWSAALALSNFGDARAVEPLVARLKDKDGNVRSKAADALHNLKYEPATAEARIAFLIAKQDWPKLEKEGSAAVDPLIACLKDKRENPRKMAAVAYEDQRMRDAVVQTLGKLGDRRAVEAIIACLKDENSGAAPCVAEALGRLGDPRAVEPLIVCLKDHGEGAATRGMTAWALGQLGDARAVEPLIVCLKDESALVRQYAAGMLGKLQGSQAVALLIPCLKDEDAEVRYCAACWLENLKYAPETAEARIAFLIAKRDWQQLLKEGSPAIGPLTACLKATTAKVREAAAETLGNLRDARAVQALILCLKDEDPDVRKAAAEALQKLGYKPEGVMPGGN